MGAEAAERATLAGRVALVTAASQGIGLACAGALAGDGATVVMMGRRKDALHGACAPLRERFPAARIEPCAGDLVNAILLDPWGSLAKPNFDPDTEYPGLASHEIAEAGVPQPPPVATVQIWLVTLVANGDRAIGERATDRARF